MITRSLSGLLLLLLAVPAVVAADVVERVSDGFRVRTVVEIAAPRDRVFSALVREIGQWWDADHTYSKDAKNLSIDARPGGCFCEALPGGGVAHGTVVFLRPNDTLRLAAALGPLQAAGVSGSLTWTLSEASGRTTVTMVYAVGGYYPGGVDTIADPVDAMISGQVRRLKAFVERTP